MIRVVLRPTKLVFDSLIYDDSLQVYLSGEELIGFIVLEEGGEGGFFFRSYNVGVTTVEEAQHFDYTEYGIIYLISYYCEVNNLPKPDLEIEYTIEHAKNI